jgi:hypothetical protein
MVRLVFELRLQLGCKNKKVKIKRYNDMHLKVLIIKVLYFVIPKEPFVIPKEPFLRNDKGTFPTE